MKVRANQQNGKTVGRGQKGSQKQRLTFCSITGSSGTSCRLGISTSSFVGSRFNSTIGDQRNLKAIEKREGAKHKEPM